MSQAQAIHIGLCSDNVITILHPSSTVESAVPPPPPTLQAGPISFTATTHISIPVSSPAHLTGVVTVDSGATFAVGDTVIQGPVTSVPFSTWVTGSMVLLVVYGGAVSGSYSLYG